LIVYNGSGSVAEIAAVLAFVSPAVADAEGCVRDTVDSQFEMN
jgi:hypothetical protein